MVAPPSPRRISLSAAIVEYGRHLQREELAGALAKTTLSTYTRDLADLKRLIGSDVVCDDITSIDLDDALLVYQGEPDARYSKTAATSAGRSPRTAARWRQSISRFFAWCEREAIVQRSPVPGMAAKPRSREPLRAERTALPRDTAKALLEPGKNVQKRAREDQDMSQRDEAILRILLDTGLRVSELTALRRDDVVVETDTAGTPRTWLVVRSGKGGKSRQVPLNAATADPLRRLMDENPDRPELFLSWRGNPLQPRDIQRLLEKASNALPPEVRRGATPHALRHTMATHLLASGAADVAVVQRLLGHASLATTGKYLDEIREELAAAVDRNPITGS